MRRCAVLLSTVALVGAAAVGGEPGVAGQDATPADPVGHPVVVGWVWDTNAADPATPRPTAPSTPTAPTST